MMKKKVYTTKQGITNVSNINTYKSNIQLYRLDVACTITIVAFSFTTNAYKTVQFIT